MEHLPFLFLPSSVPEFKDRIQGCLLCIFFSLSFYSQSVTDLLASYLTPHLWLSEHHRASSHSRKDTITLTAAFDMGHLMSTIMILERACGSCPCHALLCHVYLHRVSFLPGNSPGLFTCPASLFFKGTMLPPDNPCLNLT